MTGASKIPETNSQGHFQVIAYSKTRDNTGHFGTKFAFVSQLKETITYLMKIVSRFHPKLI